MDYGRWMMDDELFLPMGEFIFLVHFMYSPCNKLTNCYTLAVQSMLSLWQLVKLARLYSRNYACFMLCCVVLHKLSVCNFDSCKSSTCYMGYINNNKVNNLTVSFGYFPWDFPASRGLICCLYNIILYVISAAVYDNEL